MNEVSVRDGGYMPRARRPDSIDVERAAPAGRTRPRLGVRSVARLVAAGAIGLALIVLIVAGAARVGDRPADASVSIGLRSATLIAGSPTLATVSVELRNDGDSPRTGSIEASAGQAGPSRPVTIPARSRVDVDLTVAAACGVPISVIFASSGAQPLEIDTTLSCADRPSPP
jgi:hypothetical protein